MTIRQKDKLAIEEREKQLDGLHNTINENLVLARIAATQMERLRVLSLISQAYEEQKKLFEKIRSNMFSGKQYDPTLVQYRSMKVLEELENAVNSGLNNISPVSSPGIIEQEETEEEEASEVDNQEVEESIGQQDQMLAENTVKLMSMAGTEKSGDKAWWRASQVRHGLLKLHPDLDEWTNHAVLRALCNEGVVKEVKIPTDVGHESGFVLVDDYESFYDKPDFSVRESILRILDSAKDEQGYNVGWTYNQLKAAVRSESARVGDEEIEEEIENLKSEGRVATWKTVKNRYIAIDYKTVERFRAKLEKIASDHRPATPPSGSAPGDDKPKTWEGVKESLRLDESFFTTELTGKLLHHFRMQPKRLWRDYDIVGLFKYNENSYDFTKSDDGEKSLLSESLEILIELELVEFIERDTRPGMHENRWTLTSLGRVGTEQPQNRGE